MIVRTLKNLRSHSTEAIIVFVGVGAPVVVSALRVVGVDALERDGFLPLSFAIATLTLAWGLRRIGLLDAARFEQIGVIESMSDGVVLLDARDRLLGLNLAARRALGLEDVTASSQPAADLLEGHPELVALLAKAPSARTEIDLRNGAGEPAWYDVEVSPVQERERRTGRAVVLRNVTTTKRVESALQIESRRLGLLLEATAAGADATNAEQLLALSLEAICRYMEWPVGHVYRPSEEGRPILRSADINVTGDSNTYGVLVDAVKETGFAPRSGAPGRAWWTREPQFVSDLSTDGEHPRVPIAIGLGIRAAVAIPISAGSNVVAVLEFLAPSMAEVDAGMLEVMSHLGASIGRAVAHFEADRQSHGLAHFDGLTGLPNRELFRERLQNLLDSGSIGGRNLAVLFVDVDGFQRVNQEFGYGAGDEVLREIARRFHKLTRFSDVISRGDAPEGSVTLSRLGGDEFLLLLSKLSEFGDASRVAGRLVAALYDPIVVDGREVYVGASVGIALYPQDGRDADELIRSADSAMYTAKSQGGSMYRFYAETMNHLTTRQLHLEQRLREAADRNDWTLYYQPIRNAKTGRVGAVEALLRWDYPEFGIVAPGEFLNIAEDLGLSIAIGDWVLREACRQGSQWIQEGFLPIRISVNVSPRQVREGDLVASVTAALESSGLSAYQLEIEITENSILQDDDHVQRVFDQLRELGVTLALDDFGTGYSSLTHLLKFPIDRIKIDQSFVSRMESDPAKAAVVNGVIGLARLLHIDVVAEGVENETEARLLQADGCDELQGYLFSQPLPPEQVVRFLERDKSDD